MALPRGARRESREPGRTTCALPNQAQRVRLPTRKRRGRAGPAGAQWAETLQGKGRSEGSQGRKRQGSAEVPALKGSVLELSLGPLGDETPIWIYKVSFPPGEPYENLITSFFLLWLFFKFRFNPPKIMFYQSIELKIQRVATV